MMDDDRTDRWVEAAARLIAGAITGAVLYVLIAAFVWDYRGRSGAPFRLWQLLACVGLGALAGLVLDRRFFEFVETLFGFGKDE